MSIGRAILWSSSLAALGLALKSTLGEPPPLAHAVAALLVYLIVLGVLALVPRLEAFGDYLCRVPGARGLVGLTFDDGPDPQTTPRVLELLEARGQRATFFLLGWKVEAHPEVVREIHRRGHQLALHGYHHDRLYAFKPPAAVHEDLRRCQDAVERAVGVRPVLFRPPIGQASPRTFAGAKKAGVELIGWSVRPADGLRWSTPEQVLRRVVRGLTEGAIVLLHDASEAGSQADARELSSVAALPGILDALEARGLRSVTLEELVTAADEPSPDPPRPADG